MKSLHQILLAAATGFFTVDAGILPPQFLRSLAPRAFAPQTFAPQPPAPVSDTSFSNSSSISIETSAHVSNDDARFSIMSYTRLQSDYNVNNFFDQFNFYTVNSPPVATRVSPPLMTMDRDKIPQMVLCAILTAPVHRPRVSSRMKMAGSTSVWTERTKRLTVAKAFGWRVRRATPVD